MIRHEIKPEVPDAWRPEKLSVANMLGTNPDRIHKDEGSALPRRRGPTPRPLAPITMAGAARMDEEFVRTLLEASADEPEAIFSSFEEMMAWLEDDDT